MKNRVTSPGLTAMNRKVNCGFCSRAITVSNQKRHEAACYLNPENLTLCPQCGDPVQKYKESETCSYSCANKHFTTRRRKPIRYQTICFTHHEKKCIVCGEDKIVAVHHYDHNHENNDPENLIPLCPTHHAYVHSNYRDEVQPFIDEYIKQRNICL